MLHKKSGMFHTFSDYLPSLYFYWVYDILFSRKKQVFFCDVHLCIHSKQ